MGQGHERWSGAGIGVLQLFIDTLGQAVVPGARNEAFRVFVNITGNVLKLPVNNIDTDPLSLSPLSGSNQGGQY